MKKLIIIALVAAALAGFYFFSGKDGSEVKTTETISNPSFQPDPSAATFTIDGERISLSSGKATIPLGNGGLEEEISLTDHKAYGDINGDGKNDTAVLLTQAGGGSGVFVYAAAYVSGAIRYTGSNTVFIGDRIMPEDISVDNGVVIVTYLDRKPGEAFAAEPTVRTTKTFEYRNGKLQER